MRNPVVNIPNVLSVLRGLCAPVFLWAVLSESWLIAFSVTVYAVVSDLIDGPIARRLSQATALGTRIDHTADFLFSFIGLASLAIHDDAVVPAALPLLQFCAFLEYTYTGPQSHTSLLPSRLGRYNGILYFVVVATVTTQYALHLDWIPSTLIFAFCCLLVASTGVSMLFRIETRVRKKQDGQ